MTVSSPTQASPVSPPSVGGPFAHAAFRRFWFARLFAGMALQIQTVTVGWFIYDLTHSALDLGWVGLAQFLPAVGLALVTGAVADRYSRKGVLMGAFGMECLACVAMLGLALGHDTAEWPIFLIVFLFGTARAFEMPASQAILPSLVPPEVFGRAVAFNSSANQAGTIIGPAIGGLLYAIDPVFPFAAAVALYAAAFLLVQGIKLAPRTTPPRGVGWAHLFAGIAYIRSRPIVLGAISLDLFAVLLGGATALLPIFARDILQVDTAALGLLRSAPAVGALAMAIFIARFPLKRHAGKAMLAGVAVFGLATIVFGLSTNLTLSMVALVVLGMSDMISVVVRQTLVQLWTPDEMRGRVSAVSSLFIGTSNQLGEFESGLTAAWFGAVPAVVIGGVGTLTVVALWAWIFPDLRDADRLDKAA